MMNRRTTLFVSVLLSAAYGCESDGRVPTPIDDLPMLPPDEPGGSIDQPPSDPGDEPTPNEPDAGAPGDGGTPTLAWYQKCQVSDQTFVRKAIMAVLGRRPYSQAEVNFYTDLLKTVEAQDGSKPEERDTAPGSDLTHSKQVVLQALFKSPEYQTYWSNLYKDFIRVQRVDEQYNPDCFEASGGGNPLAAAKFVRDRDPLSTGPDSITMRDVIEGSIALDDVTPIYTANLMAMLSLTYAGANAEPAALELTRRADFGAWFDEVYTHRDTVCLSCHNSEFSVTQTDDPATNRHYPLPALLEKSLFDLSTGPASFGGFEGGDRAHAPLRYKWVINDCTTRTQTQAAATTAKSVFKPCPTKTELLHRCGNGELLCEAEFQQRNEQSGRPWGWAKGCGLVIKPDFIKSDLPGVEAKFGNVTGLRSSQWQMARSLRAGFDKLALEGLGADADKNVADADKSFAYLVAMNIAEKVWIQIVGTPLTIPTRFPRNAASRDQLEFLTNTLVDSNFSNQALVEAILASPYVNVSAPGAGCGDAYGMPNVFDPWVIADDDPIRRKNAATDAIVSYTARTASNALYKALEWSAIEGATFPDSSVYPKNDPLIPLVDAERQFQNETGFYLKNSEPGFRGFDFQARLGWESRFGGCQKIPGFTGPDFIDKLASFASAPDRGTVRDLIIALKDRLLGRATIDETKERPALEAMLGTTLDADGNALTDPATSLRKLCGVMVSSPQFLLAGITPKDARTVPSLTPVSASYGAICRQVAAVLPPSLKVTCSADGSSLSLNDLDSTPSLNGAENVVQ
jgi:hypothetical protein